MLWDGESLGFSTQVGLLGVTCPTPAGQTLLWMFGTRMHHWGKPSLRKQHRACGPFPSPGPCCLSLPGCSEAEHQGAGGSWSVWGGAKPPLQNSPGSCGPRWFPCQGSDCMKLFTSDFAVYKRDVGWVGGTSQASGGLGNVLSAPACSKAETTGVTQVPRGSPSQLWSMGRKAEVALAWRG